MFKLISLICDFLFAYLTFLDKNCFLMVGDASSFFFTNNLQQKKIRASQEGPNEMGLAG
jgi:hypothetical protein